MTKKTIYTVMMILVALAAIGFGYGATSVSAAEPAKQPPMMMQGMDPKAMADMMKSPDMQKQCVEMMKSPEMQQSMMTMMKQPEMQAIMKQMLQKDAGFHQMMLDLVNSVDMNHDNGPMGMPSAPGGSTDHNMHH